MSIRAARKDDFPALGEIYALSKLDELRFETQRFEFLPLQRDQRRLVTLMASDIFVCEGGDFGICGYGAIRGPEITALFVHPVARGRGIGARLLEHLLARATPPAALHVASSNAPALRLYRRFGFEVVGEFLTDYNGVPVRASRMQRREAAGPGEPDRPGLGV